MTSLFDIGRPTGSIGGMYKSEDDILRRTKEDLDNRETAQDIKRKKSEFLDYLLDADKRSEARKAAIATSQATVATQGNIVQAAPSDLQATLATNAAVTAQQDNIVAAAPSDREATISTNEATTATQKEAKKNAPLEGEETRTAAILNTAKNRDALETLEATSEFNRRAAVITARTNATTAMYEEQLLQPRFRVEQAAIHKAMSKIEMDQAATSYGAAMRMIESGYPPEEVYAQTYAGLIRGSANPAQRQAELLASGIPPEYNETNMNNLMARAKFGLMEADHVRALDLLQQEYNMRVAVERAKRKDPDADVTAKADDMKYIAAALSGQEWFADMEGKLDDKGFATDTKGSVVRAVGNFATVARQRGKSGDSRFLGPDYENIAIDVLNFSSKFAGQMPMGGMGIKGEFDIGQFNDTMSLIDQNILTLAKVYPKMEIRDIWARHGMALKQQISQQIWSDTLIPKGQKTINRGQGRPAFDQRGPKPKPKKEAWNRRRYG